MPTHTEPQMEVEEKGFPVPDPPPTPPWEEAEEEESFPVHDPGAKPA
jgi:hypothetical protein